MNIPFFEFKILDDLNKINLKLKKQVVINTINPHSFITSDKDELFKKSLLSSDYLIPDGVGIVYAIKFLYQKAIKRITGADLHSFFLDHANKNKLKVFYLGSSESTLNKIKLKLKKNYKNIEMLGYSPPFKPKLSKNDNKIIFKEINSFSPNILFVGMTAPKQEKWVYENKDKLNVNIICSIGAVFDFYSGNVKRSSPFWIKLGLEWLPRLIKEPIRLFERNFVSTPKFVFYVLRFFVVSLFNRITSF